MSKPDLQLLAKWLDCDLVAQLEKRRYLKKEWRRRRKLGTLEILWLMLAVSLDTHRSSLFEIVRLATGQFPIQWTISVAAFCRARSRFSPQCSDMAARRTDTAAANGLQGRLPPLAWPAVACGR
ncbi:MAG: hypothetical protein ACYSR5_12500 [Planctomycetota bacterium]|jgi:hypothetical protein